MGAKPVIVIDFDDTLTAMPQVYRVFVREAKAEGHRVIVMTQRIQDEENVDEVDEWMTEHRFTLPVYFTNGLSKTLELERLGISNYILHDNDPRRAVTCV